MRQDYYPKGDALALIDVYPSPALFAAREALIQLFDANTVDVSGAMCAVCHAVSFLRYDNTQHLVGCRLCCVCGMLAWIGLNLKWRLIS